VSAQRVHRIASTQHYCSELEKLHAPEPQTTAHWTDCRTPQTHQLAVLNLLVRKDVWVRIPPRAPLNVWLRPRTTSGATDAANATALCGWMGRGVSLNSTLVPLDTRPQESRSAPDPFVLANPEPGVYTVTSASPADSVFFGVDQLFPDGPQDVVISGFNRSAKAGVTNLFSGTVSAALTGALLGIGVVRGFLSGRPRHVGRTDPVKPGPTARSKVDGVRRQADVPVERFPQERPPVLADRCVRTQPRAVYGALTD